MIVCKVCFTISIIFKAISNTFVCVCVYVWLGCMWHLSSQQFLYTGIFKQICDLINRRFWLLIGNWIGVEFSSIFYLWVKSKCCQEQYMVIYAIPDRTIILPQIKLKRKFFQIVSQFFVEILRFITSHMCLKISGDQKFFS